MLDLSYWDSFLIGYISCSVEYDKTIFSRTSFFSEVLNYNILKLVKLFNAICQGDSVFSAKTGAFE